MVLRLRINVEFLFFKDVIFVFVMDMYRLKCTKLFLHVEINNDFLCHLPILLNLMLYITLLNKTLLIEIIDVFDHN